ncbi:MAG: hypothetical protein ACR2KP_09105 [Egibacteraceae bacterium]
MAVDERSWTALRHKLGQLLGEEDARTLMAKLPRGAPATREDLVGLEARLGHRIDGVERRIDGVERRMDGLEHRMGGLESHMGQVVETLEAKIQASEHRVLAALHEGLGGLRMDLIGQTKTFVFSMMATFLTLAALGVAAMRL